MKVKELIGKLKQFDQDAEVLVSSDEELNTIFDDVQIAKLEGEKNRMIFWGNSGSEVDCYEL